MFLNRTLGLLPKYDYKSYRYHLEQGFIFINGVAIPVNYCNSKCNYLSRTGQSIAAYGTTQGNSIGYSEVTELFGENGENGKIIHRFNSIKNIGRTYFPFPPQTSMESFRGLETETIIVDSNQIARSITLHYYTLNNHSGKVNTHNIHAIKIGFKLYSPCVGSDLYTKFSVEPYEIFCGWKYQNKQVNIIYDRNGLNPIYDSVKFTYDSVHLQLSDKLHFTSNGVFQMVRYKYPVDYHFTGLSNGDIYANAIRIMKDSLHIINPIIEKIGSYKYCSSCTEMVTEGLLCLWKQFDNNQILVQNQIGLEISQPIDISNFISSTISTTGTFLFDNRYRNTKWIIEKYDNYSNVLQYKDNNDLKVAFNWGYNGTRLITKAINAIYDPSNTYSGANSLITRYQYRSIFGVERIVDPNQINILYQYDPLGRLKLIRNHDQNIIQKFDYNYKEN